MRVSVDWLKDFVEIKGGLEKLQAEFTMTGLEVGSIVSIEGDNVLDIEITPNRADCLSMLGIARELAAASNKALKVSASIKKYYMKKGPASGGAKIEILDKKACPRYAGCIIKNVKVGPSPKWLVARLNAMGTRSINNIVDITNYVLFETGQPLHAFDLDKLEGKRIVVRRAKKGESLVTIDGVKRDLDPSMLVIADKERPVAIAGIMGGKYTEISNDTKTILLESAYFDPMVIRKAQRVLSLASESSYRFERGVDFGMVLSASLRAQELIKEIAGGRVLGSIVDAGGKRLKEKEIKLALDEIPRVLGIQIGTKKLMEIFSRLNLKPAKLGRSKISVKVPSYRQDLERGIDLIEEAARLYGYDKIPSKVPNFIMQKNYKEEKKDWVLFEKKAKDILYSLGLIETVTYTLTSRSSIDAIGKSHENLVHLVNPLSSNQEFMRPSLLSEMLEALAWNINRKNSPIQIFELSKIYLSEKDSGEKEERMSLSIGLSGSTNGNWKDKARPLDFFDLKGIVELFLGSIGIKNYSIDRGESFIFRDALSGSIKINGLSYGALGEIKPEISRKFDIKQKVYIAEIDIEGLFKHTNLKKAFEGLPRYPSIKRDISMLVNDAVSSSSILEVIKNEAKDFVKAVEVFDLYKGQQIEQAKKSLAYTLEYRRDDRTLKDEEVSEVHKRIQDALSGKLGAQIR